MSIIYYFLYLIPRNYLSFWTGRLARLEQPAPLARLALRLFIRLVGIDPGEAEKEPAAYPSVGAYFIRKLKPGLRVAESEIVSPVDGVHRSSGQYTEGRLLQVKGKSYTVDSLLLDEPFAARFQSGTYSNLYLTPRHYHRVHAPVSGKIVARIYCPGTLWPVNNWSIEKIDQLFCVNERVTTVIDSDYGLVAVVMVGATNVGKITLAYDELVTNQPPFADRAVTRRLFEPGISVSAGDELGIFHLGSTVVLLFENAFQSKWSGVEEIQIGQTLLFTDT